jgi:hypothetical protein
MKMNKRKRKKDKKAHGFMTTYDMESTSRMYKRMGIPAY